MSKTLRTVAVIAGAVALVATGVGAFAAAGSALATTAGSVATYASLAAGVASVGAQLLTKPPPARGSVSNVTIQVDPPTPYPMGRTYFGGMMRHDVGYGGKVKKVKNPYRGMVIAYGGGGPVQSITPYIDYQPVPSWYSGYLSTDTQLGATPEASALSPYWSGMPDWGAASKLSGLAAILWSFKFDKDGKRFGSGIPPTGALIEGVKVYDPRLDSTFPGGTGTQRIDDETTWTYSRNPALHAIAYAYGRYQNGKKVFGVGLPASGIDIARMAAWANVCDANAWNVDGVIFEPADRWNNLKDIMAAGGAEPVFANGVLTCRYRAPMVPLDTIGPEDLADGDIAVTAMQSWRDRINGIVPKFRSEAHNFEYVSTELVSVPSYVTEDGEEKVEERQYNLVSDADQAAQLATYALVDARELGPIEVTLKPQWRGYVPGECLHIALPDEGLDHDVIILSRKVDPATMTVSLILVTEDQAKHAFALGQTGAPPPTPSLTSAEDRDTASVLNGAVQTYRWPEVPPANPPYGSIYFNAENEPFRFENTELTFNEEAWTFNGDPFLIPGWVSVRDPTIAEIVESLQTIDDDGVLTIDEKIRIAIPENSRLEAIYQGVLQAATAQGLSITAATAARADWIALRDSLSPAWNDTTQPTPIARSDWDAVLDAYRSALELAKAAISGTNAITVIPPAAQEIEVNEDNEPATGVYPRNLVPTVKRGAVDIRDDDDVSYSRVLGGDIVATVNDTDGDADKGTITVTDGVEGYIDLTVTVAGVDYGPYRINFTPKIALFVENANGTAVGTRIGSRIYWRQWGSVDAEENSTGTVTFPVPYTNAASISVRTGGAGSGGTNDQDNYPTYTSTPTVTGFSWRNPDDTPALLGWSADGY